MSSVTYTEMTSATYAEVADILRVTHPDFIVCVPEVEGMCLTLYPPERYHDNQGVDVFINGNVTTFWIDGFNSRRITGAVTADIVAAAAVRDLKMIQARSHKQLA